MRDWQKLVRDRLSQLELNAAEKDEVSAELAGHLEENYRSLLQDGLPEEIAAVRSLHQVGDWNDLQRKIEFSRNQEAYMTKRVAQFWLPAFVTLLLSLVLLAVIQIFGPNPWVGPMPGGRLRMTPVAVVYLSWLVFLPFVGALGAYLSKRAGGGPRAIFSSILFPVYPYVAFFVIGLPVAILLDDHIAHNITIPAFFVGLWGWVIFPAAALLAGGLACTVVATRQLSAKGIAGS
jgi:hypothetical protein